MMTCQNCKHWLPYTAEPKLGYCAALERQRDVLMVINREADKPFAANVVTPAGFGCNQHEPRLPTPLGE